MKGEIGQFPKRFFLSGNQRLDYPGEGFIMAKMSADFLCDIPPFACANPACDLRSPVLCQPFGRDIYAQLFGQSFGCAGCLGREPYARSFETIDSNARAKSVTPVSKLPSLLSV